LRQVTLNLISHTVKFTSKGRVLLDVTMEDSEVTVSVSDSGVGISPDEHEVQRLNAQFRAKYRDRMIRITDY